MEWKTIDSAPTTVQYWADYKIFNAFDGARVFPCYGVKNENTNPIFYDLTDYCAGDGFSVYHEECKPTHWMPLPPAPATKEGE